jgi:hypothetical protein
VRLVPSGSVLRHPRTPRVIQARNIIVGVDRSEPTHERGLLFHDIGNNESIFDRLDLQPDAKDIFHLNIFWRAVGSSP